MYSKKKKKTMEKAMEINCIIFLKNCHRSVQFTDMTDRKKEAVASHHHPCSEGICHIRKRKSYGDKIPSVSDSSLNKVNTKR